MGRHSELTVPADRSSVELYLDISFGLIPSLAEKYG